MESEPYFDDRLDQSLRLPGVLRLPQVGEVVPEILATEETVTIRHEGREIQVQLKPGTQLFNPITRVGSAVWYTPEPTTTGYWIFLVQFGDEHEGAWITREGSFWARVEDVDAPDRQA